MVYSPHLPSGDIKAEHKLMITCGTEDVVAFVAVRVTSIVDISHHGGFKHSAAIGESAELKEGIQGKLDNDSRATFYVCRFLESNPSLQNIVNMIFLFISFFIVSLSFPVDLCDTFTQFMMTSSALLALCVGNSPVTGEFPPTKASDTELWCFLCYAPEQTVE